MRSNLTETYLFPYFVRSSFFFSNVRLGRLKKRIDRGTNIQTDNVCNICTQKLVYSFSSLSLVLLTEISFSHTAQPYFILSYCLHQFTYLSFSLFSFSLCNQKVREVFLHPKKRHLRFFKRVPTSILLLFQAYFLMRNISITVFPSLNSNPKVSFSVCNTHQ